MSTRSAPPSRARQLVDASESTFKDHVITVKGSGKQCLNHEVQLAKLAIIGYIKQMAKAFAYRGKDPVTGEDVLSLGEGINKTQISVLLFARDTYRAFPLE